MALQDSSPSCLLQVDIIVYLVYFELLPHTGAHVMTTRPESKSLLNQYVPLLLLQCTH